MATDLEFVQHICDQLRGVSGLSYRKMFGEFALYVNGKVVALVCDNQLFVKETDAGRALLRSPTEGPPYPGAKAHFIADEYLDDSDVISELINATAAALPEPKPRVKRKPKSEAESSVKKPAVRKPRRKTR
jgi:TfoX/Sxy family transcriptional regulator of competence genes